MGMSVSVGPVVESPLLSFVIVPFSPSVRLGGFASVGDLSLHPPTSFTRTPGPLHSPLCPPGAPGVTRAFAWPGAIPPGRSQLERPLLREVPPESPGGKDGLILLRPLQGSSLRLALSPTLSRAFACLASASPVTQQTMQGWGPHSPYPLPCPQHLAQGSREPASACSMNEGMNQS